MQHGHCRIIGFVREGILKLEARDLLFNIEGTTSVFKPEAPEVSFNYAINSTDQSFDSGYEYCLSDGK